MYMLHTESEFINELFEDHETAKAKAEQIAKEKSIIVYIFKAKEAIEVKAVSTRITDKKKVDLNVIPTEKEVSIIVSVGSNQVNVLEVSENSIIENLENLEAIATENVVEEVIQEEKKDIPLYAHEPDELIKEIEHKENNPEPILTNLDLFLVPIGEEETKKFGTPNLLKFETKEMMLDTKEKDDKYLADIDLLDQAEKEFNKAFNVPDLAKVFGKYEILNKSELKGEYKELKTNRLNELLESDLLNELKECSTKTELGNILNRYQEHIKELPTVVHALDGLFEKFKEPKKPTIEELKEKIDKAFNNCLTISDLTSSKNNFKALYPELEKESWFVKKYYDKAGNFSCSPEPKYADKMK